MDEFEDSYPQTIYPMRTALILLALVIMLGFVRESGAQVGCTRDCSLTIGGERIGLMELEGSYCVLFFGPLGSMNIFLKATPILIGLGVLFVLLVVAPMVLMVRWKRRSQAS